MAVASAALARRRSRPLSQNVIPTRSSHTHTRVVGAGRGHRLRRARWKRHCDPPARMSRHRRKRLRSRATHLCRRSTRSPTGTGSAQRKTPLSSPRAVPSRRSARSLHSVHIPGRAAAQTIRLTCHSRTSVVASHFRHLRTGGSCRRRRRCAYGFATQRLFAVRRIPTSSTGTPRMASAIIGSARLTAHSLSTMPKQVKRLSPKAADPSRFSVAVLRMSQRRTVPTANSRFSVTRTAAAQSRQHQQHDSERHKHRGAGPVRCRRTSCPHRR